MQSIDDMVSPNVATKIVKLLCWAPLSATQLRVSGGVGGIYVEIRLRLGTWIWTRAYKYQEMEWRFEDSSRRNTATEMNS